MQVYGVDLALWYAEGRVDGLLDLIDNLPGASRLTEAVTNDPEAAEELARLRLSDDSEKPDWAPRVAEFGLTEHLLSQIIDLLQSQIGVSIKAAGGKPGDVKPTPRPRTEIDAAVARLEREWTVDFLGHLGFDESYI